MSDERIPLRALHAFFITAALAAGGMFVFKLFSFLKTIKRDEMAGFAFDPIVTYGFVAMGFLFLLAWAYLTGQFRDIERPKYEMLQRVREQELAEGLPAGPAEELVEEISGESGGRAR